MLKELGGIGLLFFASRAVGALTTLITTLIVARYTPAETASSFVFYQNFALLLGVFGAAGLDQHGLRRIVQLRAEPLNGQDLVGFTRAMYLAATISFIAAACLGSLLVLPLLEGLGFGARSSATVNATACAWALVMAMRLVLVSLLRGLGHTARASLCDGPVAGLLSVAAVSVAVTVDHDLQSLEIMAIVVGCNAVPLLMCCRSIPPVRVSLSRLDEALQLLRVSAPLMVPTSVSFLMTQAALVAAHRFGSNDDAIGLGLAFQVYSGASLAFVAAHIAAGPYIVRQHARGELTRSRLALRLFAGVAALPAFVAAIVFLVDQGAVLATLVGPRFAQYSPVVAALCLGRALQICLGLNHTLLIMLGHYQPYLLVQPLFILIGLTTILAGSGYGPLGIAVGFGASLVMQNIVLLYLVRYCRQRELAVSAREVRP